MAIMHYTRRMALLKGGALAGVAAATPALAFRGAEVREPAMPDWWKKLTRDEQVLHHMREIQRIVSETRPAGTKAPLGYLITHGQLICHAYPQGYSDGDRHAVYEPDRGGWKMIEGGTA